MSNYIGLVAKIACFCTISVLFIGCGSGVRQGKSEFASPTQSLDAILQQADQAEPAQKNPLLVQAAGLLIADQRQEKALELLLHIDNRYLNSKQKDTFHLFYGEALLADELEDRSQTSLQQLLSVVKPSVHSIEWQIRYFQSLSDSYLANHNYLEAAKRRIELDDLIDDPEVLSANNEKIWFSISQMGTKFLRYTISDFNSKRVNGWLEIVQINQEYGNQPDLLIRKMENWKQRYPLHPAMVVQPRTLQRVALAEMIAPKKIAILLPLSGRFANSGKMVQDGLVAAHYQVESSQDAATINFYDTAKSQSGLVSYQQAINDGADFIIGPLDKRSIEQIVAQDTLATPIFFLNTINSMPERHNQVFQFVLSIEDEAIQAAHRAWENGYRKAIAFVPDDPRGQRARIAFQEYFEQLGGEVIDTEKYSDIKKLKANVQNLLRVDKSIKRKRQLEQTLGRNIEFEMRRRQDADFIFMLSKPREARRIKPFINFYFALDLPVISTSRIYSGKPSPQLDNELDGIEFSDIPLYISQQPEILKTRKEIEKIDSSILKDNNGRLFSYGFDAYQILSNIAKLKAFPDYRWYGLSGEIGIDDGGLVHRYLTWAKFKKGIPEVSKERLPPIFESKQPNRQNPKEGDVISGH